MTLDAYHTLGRSGLRVSPLALGALTFGGASGFGVDKDTSRALFDAYLDAGGNCVDTADMYSAGASEDLLGEFMAERGVRDRVVVSTKFSLGHVPGDPNSAGNGRKSMLRALEGSLRRLRTDYVDLYILHLWDAVTPVEEVMRGLDDLVSQGKVRYVAFSDVPAWYAARAQTLAQWRGFEPLCALQLEYSLLERGIEYEFPPMCEELGTSLMVWGPLANGLLTGKYRADDLDSAPDGRLKTQRATFPPELLKLNDRTWVIVAELAQVAREVGRPMAQVALNWVADRPAVGTVVVGVTKVEQLRDNLGSLDFTLPDELRRRLDDVSAPPRAVPYSFLDFAHARSPRGLGEKRRGYYARDRASVDTTPKEG